MDRLDGSNWITWKFQMKHLLLGTGLWKYIDGSAVLAESATEVQQKSKGQNLKLSLSKHFLSYYGN